MLRINLIEPSFLNAVKEGRKSQVTFPWPANFSNQSNDVAIYYPEGEDLRILGVAKIKSLLKIQGGIVPSSSSYEEAYLWAQKEGFNSFGDANDWFSAKYGANWQEQTWGIIQFKGEWGSEYGSC